MMQSLVVGEKSSWMGLAGWSCWRVVMRVSSVTRRRTSIILRAMKQTLLFALLESSSRHERGLAVKSSVGSSRASGAGPHRHVHPDRAKVGPLGRLPTPASPSARQFAICSPRPPSANGTGPMSSVLAQQDVTLCGGTCGRVDPCRRRLRCCFCAILMRPRHRRPQNMEGVLRPAEGSSNSSVPRQRDRQHHSDSRRICATGGQQTACDSCAPR